MRKFLIFLLFIHLSFSKESITLEQCYQHQKLWKLAVKNAPAYPEGKYEGKGIVVCAGNPIYLINAWIHLNFLRETGCCLPVELWYYGNDEICTSFIELFSTIGVECLDLEPLYPNLNMGFQFKPFAVIASKFKEVLLLDADNLPLKDPTPCFEWTQYKNFGAVFWPDLHMIKANNPIWKVLDISPPSLPFSAQESGQVLLNKQQCWQPLQLTLHMNVHNDFYYYLLYGDKDTFQFAWKALKKPFFFIPFYPAITISEGKSFVQRHFNGTPLFYHASNRKIKDINSVYELGKKFYFMRQPHLYPDRGYMKYYSECLFSDGSIAKKTTHTPVCSFNEASSLEIRANQFLQRVFDSPLLMDWIRENKDRQATGNQHFPFRF